MVPPELRDAHRAGIARVVAGDAPRLLGRRVELPAVRRDGRRIPVELTITRIGASKQPMFTGHVRDITERVEAEAELKASRARVVEAGDDARRRIERDLHDGAQQRLVALAFSLRLAENRAREDPAASAELLAAARSDLGEALTELRELARGIHPAVLTESGLAPALTGLVRRSPVPVETDIALPDRLSPAVEAAAYYVAAEALANVARHSGARVARLWARVEGGRLVFGVGDDGSGGADMAAGSGLRGLADRLAALDGTLDVDSAAGGGSTVSGSLPLG
jgi:signal transduction histidine kinase